LQIPTSSIPFFFMQAGRNGTLPYKNDEELRMSHSEKSLNRRLFLTGAAQAGLGLGACTAALGQPNPTAGQCEPEAEGTSQTRSRRKHAPIVLDPCDVAVVGSGSGGLSAAIAAARNGAKVLLLEGHGYLGGLMSSGLCFLGFLDGRGRPVVGGFAMEWVDRLTKIGGALGVRKCPKHYSMMVVKPDLCKILASDLCEENRIDVLLHSYLTDATTENGKIAKAIFSCAGNSIEVNAKIFVDATGDGTLAYLAGAAHHKGNEKGEMQPPSVLYTLGGVDKEKFFAWLEKHPEEMGEYSLDYLRESPNWCFVTLGGLFKQLQPKGQWPIDIWAFLCINGLNEGQVIVNGPRMLRTDATDPRDLTKAERKGARQVLAFTEVLQKHVGGFERCYLSHINDSLCIRETRRIVGRKQLRLKQALAASIPDDTIALAAYFIDIHSSKDFTSQGHRVENPYGIPYLCLVGQTYDNLMMSGRCISVDEVVFGSTRVMGTCLAVGEAAGVGAALAIRNRCNPAEVNAGEIRQILRKNGAVLSV
jgi:hypothetical protein